jgi:hypothetical protein
MYILDKSPGRYLIFYIKISLFQSNFSIKKIGTPWVQVANATLNFGIICQKKGVAYDPLLSVKY